jgi:hypothetical protein
VEVVVGTTTVNKCGEKIVKTAHKTVGIAVEMGYVNH